jgi:DNA-binding NtrC family response regulator
VTGVPNIETARTTAPRATVLVIDDDQPTLDALTSVLVDAGYSVETAADSRAGLSAFLRHAPDLVITNITMSEENGVDAIMEMKREHTQARIVAISGGGGIGSMDIPSTAKCVGADATLNKPFNAGDLLVVLERLLPHGATPPPQSPAT